MSYEITRLETSKNREGQDEVFISATIQDAEIGEFTLAKWLTPVEMQTYVADNASIDGIVEANIPQARIRKVAELEYIANNPIETPTE